jgi:hypothetical protein
MGQLKARVIDWWRRKQRTVPRIDKVEYYERQSEAPISIPRHKLVLIGKGDHLKWAMFECPCGTGHKIMVNLATSRSPHWRIAMDNGHPSLRPSIDYQDGHGRCHFWLRAGRVQFTPDSIRPRRRRDTLGDQS